MNLSKTYQNKSKLTLISSLLLTPTILFGMETEPPAKTKYVDQINYLEGRAQVLQQQNYVCALSKEIIKDENYAFPLRDEKGNLRYLDIEYLVHWLEKNSTTKSVNGEDQKVWKHPFLDRDLEHHEILRVQTYYHTRKAQSPSYLELSDLFKKFLRGKITLSDSTSIDTQDDILKENKTAFLLERYINFEFLDRFFSGENSTFRPNNRKDFIAIAGKLLENETEGAWLFRPSTLFPIPLHQPLENKIGADGQVFDYKMTDQGIFVDAEGNILPNERFMIFKTLSNKATKNNPFQNSVMNLEKDLTKLTVRHSRWVWVQGVGYSLVGEKNAETFKAQRWGDYSCLTEWFSSIPRFLLVANKDNWLQGFLWRKAKQGDYPAIKQKL